MKYATTFCTIKICSAFKNLGLYCREIVTPDFKVNGSSQVGCKKKTDRQVIFTINTIGFQLLSSYEIALHHCKEQRLVFANVSPNCNGLSQCWTQYIHPAALCCVVFKPLTCLFAHDLALFAYDPIRSDTNS